MKCVYHVRKVKCVYHVRKVNRYAYTCMSKMCLFCVFYCIMELYRQCGILFFICYSFYNSSLLGVFTKLACYCLSMLKRKSYYFLFGYFSHYLYRNKLVLFKLTINIFKEKYIYHWYFKRILPNNQDISHDLFNLISSQ